MTDIAWWRDLVIIVTGAIEIIILLVIGFLALAIFRQIKKVGKSVQGLSGSVQEVVGSVKSAADSVTSVSDFAREEMAEPLIRTADLVQGAFRGLTTALGFFRRK